MARPVLLAMVAVANLIMPQSEKPDIWAPWFDAFGGEVSPWFFAAWAVWREFPAWFAGRKKVSARAHSG